MYQDPGERSSDPTRDWARLSCVCLGVSGGGVGWEWPAAGSGHCQQQSWEAQHAGIRTFGGGHRYAITPTIVWPEAKLEGGSIAPPISRKLDERFTEYGPAHQSKTQFSPQPVPPIWKLPQASYPHPSEGRQKESQNHRKITKMITWIPALCNSVRLWAMPCRASQDGQVMVESSDKTWSTGEENGKPLQHSYLENPTNCIKRQKDMTLKDELPGWYDPLCHWRRA